jgi:hypothetical protein
VEIETNGERGVVSVVVKVSEQETSILLGLPRNNKQKKGPEIIKKDL